MSIDLAKIDPQLLNAIKDTYFPDVHDALTDVQRSLNVLHDVLDPTGFARAPRPQVVVEEMDNWCHIYVDGHLVTSGHNWYEEIELVFEHLGIDFKKEWTD